MVLEYWPFFFLWIKKTCPFKSLFFPTLYCVPCNNKSHVTKAASDSICHTRCHFSILQLPAPHPTCHHCVEPASLYRFCSDLDRDGEAPPKWLVKRSVPFGCIQLSVLVFVSAKSKRKSCRCNHIVHIPHIPPTMAVGLLLPSTSNRRHISRLFHVILTSWTAV